MEYKIKCINFIWRPKNTLIGYATIQIPEWNIEIVDIQYHNSLQGKGYILMPKNREARTSSVSTIRFIDHKKKYPFFEECCNAIDVYLKEINAAPPIIQGKQANE
jgi:hypothetical protein